MPKYTHGHDVALGTVVGTGQTLVFPRSLRSMHFYVPGATGVGKSKLLEHMVRQHLRDWRRHRCGMILLDPHGSLYDPLLAWSAQHKLDRPIVPIDLRNDEYVLSYNLLRARPTASPSVVIDALVQAMAYVWGASGTDQTPLLARWAANVFQVLYEKGHTLVEAIALLDDETTRAVLTANLVDRMTDRDWRMAANLSRKDLEQQLGSTINRLQRFLRNESMRMSFGQNHASLDLRSALDDGAMILVSLATEGGKVSKENADLYGTLLLTDLVEAAKERGKREGGKRDSHKPFYVFMDEAQRFVTPAIGESLDEMRGFGLHFTIANQFPAQFRDRGPAGQQLYNSVMENASSKAVFRLTNEENLRPLAQQLFMGVMNPDEIKHELYSTKVMSYREELRLSRTETSSRSSGGGISRGRRNASGSGESRRADPLIDDTGTVSSNRSEDESLSDQESWQESEGSSVSEQTVLVPELGHELSNRQFRSLEEQMFRAMAGLFDQQQRRCVVRLVGMKVPVSLEVPFVRPATVSKARVDEYRLQLLSRLPYAMTKLDALRRLALREKTLLAVALRAEDGRDTQEVQVRRKIDPPV